MHIDLFQRLVINPASLTALAFEKMGPRLVAFNETGSLDHLRPKPEPAAQEGEAAAQASDNGAALEMATEQKTE
jgi:probable phosphoglycerate mutase